MNDTIKIRVWHKTLKEWVEDYPVGGIGKNINTIFEDKDVVFQRSVSMFDSADKEIFEGDILLVKGDTLRMMEEVRIIHGHACIGRTPIWPEYDMTVIGNIFENPGIMHAQCKKPEYEDE